MEQFFSIFQIIPDPFGDIAIVGVLFLFTVVISLILAFLFESKPEQIEEVTEEVPIEGHEEIAEESEAEELAPPAEPVETVPEVPPATPETQEATEEPVTEIQETVEEIAAESDAAAQDIQTQDVEEVVEEEFEEEPEETPEGLFARLRNGLSKTNAGLFGKLGQVLSKRQVDASLWDDFEETLIMADLGVSTTMQLRESVETKLSKQSLTDAESVTGALKEDILEILKKAEGKHINVDAHPSVIMIAGVNGVGKTTTIGKLANKIKKDDKSVMVAAGDTFRAAATEQLEIWSNRVGSEFLKGQQGADPSAVAFDAVKASESRGLDVLIVDTAGRLHTKGNLMDELKKMKRVIGNALEGAPHETLLVLDATTGQNAVQQAKMFDETLDITGIVLTKLDGTAKGGVIVAIANELNVPVKYIGIGESLSDLREFNAEEFVEALFYSGEETLH